ncbi:hypothetical protein E2562_031376 [Oryza meyeriana var. granulata]|uniref:Uncharacterized protein n=1 Tax=Oryza meyeriana var. granulata TaxID=110450 RepID=A0A6G1DQN1_9ORYZ|nr:hypothetical protein E2562_031376 [Oryza meyeriana var. granulata]
MKKTLEAHVVVLSMPQLRSVGLFVGIFCPQLRSSATLPSPHLHSAAVTVSLHLHSAAPLSSPRHRTCTLQPCRCHAPALCSHTAVAAPALYSRAAATPALCSHVAVAAAATWIEDVMLQRGKL